MVFYFSSSIWCKIEVWTLANKLLRVSKECRHRFSVLTKYKLKVLFGFKRMRKLNELVSFIMIWLTRRRKCIQDFVPIIQVLCQCALVRVRWAYLEGWRAVLFPWSKPGRTQDFKAISVPVLRPSVPGSMMITRFLRPKRSLDLRQKDFEFAQ